MKLFKFFLISLICVVGIVLVLGLIRQSSDRPLLFSRDNNLAENVPADTSDPVTGADTGTTNPETGATPQPDTAASTKVNATAGTYSQTLTHDGRTRNYLLHLPQGYSTSQSYPLVLLLHGGEGTAEGFLDQTGMRAKADAAGFIVVAPNAVAKNWNDKRGGTNKIGDPDGVTEVDDVGFLATLVEVLGDQYAVDTNRVYSTGISNGAFMSQRLACDTRGLLAAIAPVAGPMIEGMVESCPQPDQVAVIGIQGTDDPFISIPDSDGIPQQPRMLARSGVPQTIMSVDEIINFWPAANNCNTNVTPRTIADRVGDGTTIDVYEFNSCTAGTAVAYYIIEGAGHTWPPANPSASSNLTNMLGGVSSNIVANDVIWDFFTQYTVN